MLQKHVTKTGTHYVLSIPREIAQALDLHGGGLCSIEIRPMAGGKAEVVLDNYQESPIVIDHFDLSEAEVVKIPLEKPVTKGPSRSVFCQELKLRLASLRIALKFLKVVFPPRRRRRKRFSF
jgi:hypothetical protein